MLYRALIKLKNTMKNLNDYRKSYTKGDLNEEDLSRNPFDLFEKWFLETESQIGNLEVNAMTIASIGKDGFPKSRVVLLKNYSEKGFVFFTNYKSDKGRAIAHNPKVCLSFFWGSTERQIIIKGIAEKISEEESTAYFLSRPRGSQIGAIASHQSEKISSRTVLDDAVAEIEKSDKPLVRPEVWGGYIVKPVEIEFWQGRENRLHDRFLYECDGDNWIHSRLAP